MKNDGDHRSTLSRADARAVQHYQSTRNRSMNPQALFRNHFQKHEPCNVYNMDETGFALGTTQYTRVIVDSSRTCTGGWPKGARVSDCY